jgi:hypothetical protein
LIALVAPRRFALVGSVFLTIGTQFLLLLVTAMMYRSFTSELGSGPGFRHDHMAMMGFDPTLVRYTEAQTQQFYKQIVERAASVPGVASAALTSMIPMMPGGIDSDTILPEGFQPPKEKVEFPMFKYTVDEHFFNTMGIPLVRGRGILASDMAAAPKVAVVNELVAKKYWPNQDPIGKRFHVGDANGLWVQVVGVHRAWIRQKRCGTSSLRRGHKSHVGTLPTMVDNAAFQNFPQRCLRSVSDKPISHSSAL